MFSKNDRVMHYIAGISFYTCIRNNQTKLLLLFNILFSSVVISANKRILNHKNLLSLIFSLSFFVPTLIFFSRHLWHNSCVHVNTSWLYMYRNGTWVLFWTPRLLNMQKTYKIYMYNVCVPQGIDQFCLPFQVKVHVFSL